MFEYLYIIIFFIFVLIGFSVVNLKPLFLLNLLLWLTFGTWLILQGSYGFASLIAILGVLSSFKILRLSNNEKNHLISDRESLFRIIGVISSFVAGGLLVLMSENGLEKTSLSAIEQSVSSFELIMLILLIAFVLLHNEDSNV